MNGYNRPSIGTADSSDRGARLARLQDLIERDARGSAHGLPTIFHEVAAVGAMHAPCEDDVILVTLVNAAGQSHVFALDRPQATHFREELVSLRRTTTAIANHTNHPRAAITKPGGRLL
jgi:hypothetical protein